MNNSTDRLYLLKRIIENTRRAALAQPGPAKRINDLRLAFEALENDLHRIIELQEKIK